MKNLLILGAGQYGQIAREIAEAIGQFERISFLDDNSSAAIGKLSDFYKCTNDFDSAVVAIGDAETRLKLIEQLIGAGYDVPVLTHPRAYVAPSAEIDLNCGTIIGARANVPSCTKIDYGQIVRKINVGEGNRVG